MLPLGGDVSQTRDQKLNITVRIYYGAHNYGQRWSIGFDLTGPMFRFLRSVCVRLRFLCSSIDSVQQTTVLPQCIDAKCERQRSTYGDSKTSLRRHLLNEYSFAVMNLIPGKLSDHDDNLT